MDVCGESQKAILQPDRQLMADLVLTAAVQFASLTKAPDRESSCIVEFNCFSLGTRTSSEQPAIWCLETMHKDLSFWPSGNPCPSEADVRVEAGDGRRQNRDITKPSTTAAVARVGMRFQASPQHATRK
jgi:hypothetical protein